MTIFTWDGSYLGILTDEHIISQWTVIHNSRDHYLFWKVHIGPEIAVCLVRETKNFQPNIIDELKTVFRLPKHGTHSVFYRRSLYILRKAILTDEGSPIIEAQLSLLSIPPKDINVVVRNQIQETLCFRDILALISTHEGSIRFRHPTNPKVNVLSSELYRSENEFGQRRLCDIKSSI